jgi:serine protease Do
MRRLLTRKGLTSLVAIGGLAVVAALMMTLSQGDARAQSESRSGYLGVTLQDLNTELRSSYGFQKSGGVLVSDLDDGGPADVAGIKQGDILIRFKGRSIESVDDLASRVRASGAGETVAITAWRSGRERSFKVELGSRSQSGRRRIIIDDDDLHEMKDFHWVMPDIDVENWRDIADDIRVVISHRARLGVRTQDLDGQLGEYFGVAEGVLVTEVIEDTPAERAGLKAGDVILEVAGKEIDDTSELRQELAERGAGEVRITILRKGARNSVVAELEEPRQQRGFSYQMHPRHRGQTYRWRSDDDHQWQWDEGDMSELRRELRQMQRELEKMRRELRDLDSEENHK